MARGSGTRDRTAPVVNITFPANNQIFTSAQTITITATATDNKAVARVEFSVRNDATGAIGALATDTTSPYSASWPVPTQVGLYTITARAVDTSGNAATHSIVVNRTDSTTTTTTTTATPAPVLPTSKILVTPSAFNQGSEGSCNAQTVALIRSIEQYYTTGATSYSSSTNIMSAEWIYNTALCCTSYQSESELLTCFSNPSCLSCGNGSYMVRNFDTIYTVGVPRNSVCPYNSQDGCSVSNFTQLMIDDAANYKSTYYGVIPSNDLYSMKRMLANNHALAFAFQMDSNYYNSTCGYIWNSRGTLMYSHSMTIIGYDDSKNAWLAQNSWGTNWGCNGQIWIDYNFFATAIAGSVFWMTTRVDKNPYPIL